MNRRYLLLVLAVVVVALWLSGLLSATCEATGRSGAGCDSLTSTLVGLFVGGLISFWASAQVAAASDRDTKARLAQLTTELKAAIDEKLQAATTTLTGAVDAKLQTVSQDLTAQMQKDLQAVADEMNTALPSATATAVEARQQVSLAIASLPLLVKALPHLISWVGRLPSTEEPQSGQPSEMPPPPPRN